MQARGQVQQWHQDLLSQATTDHRTYTGPLVLILEQGLHPHLMIQALQAEVTATYPEAETTFLTMPQATTVSLLLQPDQAAVTSIHRTVVTVELPEVIVQAQIQITIAVHQAVIAAEHPEVTVQAQAVTAAEHPEAVADTVAEVHPLAVPADPAVAEEDVNL